MGAVICCILKICCPPPAQAGALARAMTAWMEGASLPPPDSAGMRGVTSAMADAATAGLLTAADLVPVGAGDHVLAIVKGDGDQAAHLDALKALYAPHLAAHGS